MRHAVFGALAMVGLVGCGGDGDGDATSSTGGATGPRGAVSLEIYRADVATCPWASIPLEIGNVKASPPDLVTNGQSGASVGCTVAPGGGPFSASADLSQGGTSFGFDDLSSDGKSATGTISFVAPDGSGARFATDPGSLCVFQFAPGSAQGIGEGHVFVQFDCPRLMSDADAGIVCASRYGYVAVEQCATSAM